MRVYRYNSREQHALSAAQLVLALSEKDRGSLRALLLPPANDIGIHILLPPLRAEIHALAGQQGSDLIAGPRRRHRPRRPVHAAGS